MPLLRLTPNDLQKLIKLHDPPLAATPSFSPLVENRLAGMIRALFFIPRRPRRVLGITPSPTTRRIRRDIK